MPKEYKTKDKGLYMIVDLKNKELPLCVGDIYEISQFINMPPCIIRARIEKAKKRGCKCKFVRIEENMDGDM